MSSESGDTLTKFKDPFKVFLKTFLLSFGLRYSLSAILQILDVLRKGKFRDLLSWDLFSEKRMIVRVEALRIGLAFGGFAGLYNLFLNIFGVVEDYQKKKKNEDEIEKIKKWKHFVSGLLSGITLLFFEKDDRRSVSLYVLARLSQCVYNALKSRGKWHFWGSDWSHGDALLFAVSSAQIMYAYVMRPETLPASYNKFIIRTGPIAEDVLCAVRATNRDKDVDLARIAEYVSRVNPNALPIGITKNPPIIPCSILHPQNSSCTHNFFDVLLSSAKKILPLYSSLTILPMIIFGYKKFLFTPLKQIIKVVGSISQSTLFLASFVALYQSVICLQRNIVSKDHKIIYFIAGLVSSTSILFEKKGRRSELALYALPRALDSLYMILCDHKWMGSVPQGELILFCLSMGGIMYFYENEKETMSPLLVSILKKVLDK